MSSIFLHSGQIPLSWYPSVRVQYLPSLCVFQVLFHRKTLVFLARSLFFVAIHTPQQPFSVQCRTRAYAGLSGIEERETQGQCATHCSCMRLLEPDLSPVAPRRRALIIKAVLLTMMR